MPFIRMLFETLDRTTGAVFVLKGKNVKSREDLLLGIRIWDGLQKGLRGEIVSSPWQKP